MHFALTEEQAAIQETALTFAKERIAPHAAEWDEKCHFPVDVIRETAPLGMATIYVPAEQGGSGLSRMDGALIMEALAYGCPAIAGYISIHNMVAWMVAKYASEAQVKAWMPKLASMEWLSSYCLTEPGAGSDAAGPQDDGEALGRSLRAQRQQAVHLRRRRHRLLFRVRAHGRRRRQRRLGLRGDEGHARPLVRRQREEDGLERAADAAGDLRELQGAGGQPDRRGRARASSSP